MKKVLLTTLSAAVIIASLVFVAGFFYQKTPCDRTLFYSLGSIDTRFNLKESEILTALVMAEKVWEEPLARNLFEYKPGAKFSINFIYDERQRMTVEQSREKAQIETASRSYANNLSSYNDLLRQREILISAHESLFNAYKKDLNSYNNLIDELNRKGGANPEEKALLETSRNNLNLMVQDLNSKKNSVEAIDVQIRNLASKITSKSSEINAMIDSFNRKYADSKKFDQAVYDGERINIFEFASLNNLSLAMAHEFGHALGLGHSEQPDSIMYYFSENSDEEASALSKNDLLELKNMCRIK